MQTKKGERRRAILAVAASMFAELGYERVSMAAIAARSGRSKATLYSYFQSKEALFAAVMVEAMEERGQRMLALLDSADEDLRTVLERFGHAYLALLLSPEGVGATRTVIAETGRSDLGAQLYALGPRRFWDQAAAYIERKMARGALAAGSARLAALHLQGLLEAGVVEPALFGAKPLLDRDAGVKAAVDLFLRDCAANSDAEPRRSPPAQRRPRQTPQDARQQ